MSSSAASLSGAAGRYASAVFDLAKSNGALDSIEKEFASLGSVLKENADLSRAIASPLYSREQLSAVMNKVTDSLGLSQLAKNFVGLMAAKGRLGSLKGAMDGYQTLLAKHRNSEIAYVTSAKPLSDAQRTALADNLNRSLGKAVTIEETVDPSLLGGLVVKVGSKMVDASLKSKLERLELAMKDK